MGVLHGVSASPFVRKVRVAFQEKGIPYDLDPVMPFNVSPEYKKMSPLGKIPCYSPKPGVDIPDSSVIIAYVERTNANNSLYPENPEDYARALFIEEYGDSALVAAVGTVFFQRIVGPMFMGQTTDEAAIKTALEQTLPPLLSWLDEQIKGKEFFVGNKLSVADIAIASPFVNFMHAGEKVDAAKYPNLAAFLERMHSRPSFRSVIEEERAMFGQAA
jgi:glutathione S-transferase